MSATLPTYVSNTTDICQQHCRHSSANGKAYYLLPNPACRGIGGHLDLQDIASFLNVTPQMLSRIRKEISFGAEK